MIVGTGWMKMLNMHADQLFPASPDQLFGLVIAANNHPSCRIRPEDGVITIIQDQPELLDADAEGLLHPLALRDIPHMQ